MLHKRTRARRTLADAGGLPTIDTQDPLRDLRPLPGFEIGGPPHARVPQQPLSLVQAQAGTLGDMVGWGKRASRVDTWCMPGGAPQLPLSPVQARGCGAG